MRALQSEFRMIIAQPTTYRHVHTVQKMLVYLLHFGEKHFCFFVYPFSRELVQSMEENVLLRKQVQVLTAENQQQVCVCV